MKNNMGSLDRGVRIVVGLLLVGAGALLWSGLLQILAVVVGIVLLLTSIVGYCPIYDVLKMDTSKHSGNK